MSESGNGQRERRHRRYCECGTERGRRRDRGQVVKSGCASSGSSSASSHLCMAYISPTPRGPSPHRPNLRIPRFPHYLVLFLSANPSTRSMQEPTQHHVIPTMFLMTQGSTLVFHAQHHSIVIVGLDTNIFLFYFSM